MSRSSNTSQESSCQIKTEYDSSCQIKTEYDSSSLIKIEYDSSSPIKNEYDSSSPIKNEFEGSSRVKKEYEIDSPSSKENTDPFRRLNSRNWAKQMWRLQRLAWCAPHDMGTQTEYVYSSYFPCLLPVIRVKEETESVSHFAAEDSNGLLQPKKGSGKRVSKTKSVTIAIRYSKRIKNIEKKKKYGVVDYRGMC